MADVTVRFMNEKPTEVVETNDVKHIVKEVTRTVKTVNGEETTGLYVDVAVAKTLEGMVEISGNSVEKALEFFNAGYFSTLRAKASNELSGGSEEDKAFARVVKAVKNLPMFAGKNEEEITTLLRENPALMALFGTK